MIPADDFGGTGAPLCFLHANGYPPACYRPLLERLAQRRQVSAMRQRPLWPGAQPEELQDWRPLAGDLLDFLAPQNIPVDCVGHSLGAVTLLRAALRQPERFKALVLLDPVLFPPELSLSWSLVTLLGLGRRLNPLVPAALRRRRRFESREAMFASYRRKEVFRRLDADCLRALVAGLTRPAADGTLELVYPPEWEAHIYATALRHDLELWRGLPRLQVPALILRGAETDTFWERTARLVGRRAPGVQVVTLPQSSHLLPLERPQAVAGLILDFLH